MANLRSSLDWINQNQSIHLLRHSPMVTRTALSPGFTAPEISVGGVVCGGGAFEYGQGVEFLFAYLARLGTSQSMCFLMTLPK